MSKKLSIASILFLTSLLAACGNGNNDQPVVGTYAYNGVSYGGQCSPQVALDWNRLVASRCNNGFQGPGNHECSSGVEEFIARDQGALQGPGCALVTAQTQWCPGENWRSQQTFQVNMPILQSILTQNGGPSSFPVNGGGFGGGGQFPR
ncbi:MAG: hypothetical protein ACXWSD_16875 [Bdellovibrionota bacterium]